MDSRVLRGVLFVAVGLLALWPTVGIALHSPAATAGAYAANLTDAWVFDCVADRVLEGRFPYGDPWLTACVGERGGAPPTFALPFRYPPTSLPLFAGLGFLDPRAGVVATAVLGLVACLVAAFAWLRPSDVRGFVMLALGLGWSVPAFLNAALAQTGTWLAAACLGLVAAPAPIQGGLLLAAIGLKPQYGVPLGALLLARAAWREVAVGAAATAAVAVGVELWLGPGVTAAWLHALTDDNDTLAAMATWRALAPAFRDPALDVPSIGAWLVACGVLAVASRRMERERAVAFVLPIAAALSPNSHPYDLAIWALPAAVIARDRGHRPEAGVLVLGVVLQVIRLGAAAVALPVSWRVTLAPIALAIGLGAAWGGRGATAARR
jgi:hypothetical protein